MTTEDHVHAVHVSTTDALRVEMTGVHLVPPEVAATMIRSGRPLFVAYAQGLMVVDPETGIYGDGYGTWILQVSQAATLFSALEKCAAALPPDDRATWEAALAHCAEHPEHQQLPTYAVFTRTGIGDEPEPDDEPDDRCKCGNPNCGAC